MKSDIKLLKYPNNIFLKEIKSKKDINLLDECDGYLIDTSGNELEVRKIIDSLRRKGKIIAVVGHNNHFNRRVLETMPVRYLVSPEKYLKQDNLKQRDSGLNHVLAKIAKQKNISIMLDFTDLKKLRPFELSNRIGRISQNLRICRKTNTKINIATFAKSQKDFIAPKELFEFMLSIGASTKQAKESIEYY